MAGDRNPSATQAATYTKASPKHTPESLATVLNSLNLSTLGGSSHNPEATKETYRRQPKKNGAPEKSFPEGARRHRVRIEHSKHVGREPSAASHGDYRRSLYEVTINSMGKV
jgi:hypothetical protein